MNESIEILTDKQLDVVKKTIKEKGVGKKVYQKFIGIGIDNGIPEICKCNGLTNVAELRYYLLLMNEITGVDLIKELVNIQVKKTVIETINSLTEKRKEEVKNDKEDK